MANIFRSTQIAPRARGREFGSAHAAQIARVVAIYREIFSELAGRAVDMVRPGWQALARTAVFAPAIHDEMLGMAEGAGLEPALIGAINARTEIMAAVGAAARGECSAVIALAADNAPPIAVQTWDWLVALADSWLVWEIPLADGSVTKTVTEYGIVGKAGLNTRGLGVLFTILAHRADGADIGVPVHVVARCALDYGVTIARAAEWAVRAAVSASSSINLAAFEHGCAAALSVELYPGGPGLVMPDAQGLLIHTNHFLAEDARGDDLEAKRFPDTLLRRDVLGRRLAGGARDQSRVIAAMKTHLGGDGAVCCHPDPRTAPAERYETLATLVLDLAGGNLDVHAGGPCTWAI